MYSDVYSTNMFAELFSGGTAIVSLLICAVMLIAFYKVFSKAGIPGWVAFIPVVNTYYMFKMVMGSGWKMLLMLIPLVNFVVAFIFLWKFAKAFGYGLGMFLLLLLCAPVAYLVIGFGGSQYMGPQ